MCVKVCACTASRIGSGKAEPRLGSNRLSGTQGFLEALPLLSTLLSEVSTQRRPLPLFLVPLPVVVQLQYCRLLMSMGACVCVCVNWVESVLMSVRVNIGHILTATVWDHFFRSYLLRLLSCVCGCAFDHALVCVCFSAVSGDVTGPLSWPCTCGLSHSLSLTQCSATGHELMQETEPHTRTHTHMPKVEPPAS